MRWYKGIMVGKGSALYKALEDKDESSAKKIYKDTTERFEVLYGTDGANYLMAKHREYNPKAVPPTEKIAKPN